MEANDKKTIAAYLQADWRNQIEFVAEYNPRGCYDFIQKNYPGLLDQWENGYEITQGAKQSVQDFLSKRAEESRNAEAFAVNVLNNIPYNPNVGDDSWTKIHS